MTIVIALSCRDGVVMASDSQASETGSNVRFPVTKVFELTGRAVWGGSGDAETISRIYKAFQATRDQVEQSQDMAQDLVNCVRPVLVQRYSNVIQAPGWSAPQPATITLACGYTSGAGSWIVEVDPNCVSSHYGDRGFHAIGSAAGFAALGNVLLAHFRPAEKSLKHGRLIAYRVIDAAIETSMFGVGGPIQMWYVDSDGVHQVDTDELAVIRDTVGAWQQQEEQMLDELLGAKPPEPAPLPSASDN